ncbi:zinc ribbon domain-containing protein [Desulfobotulus sp. H1]|uniref:Zinc ribbon domain-containing protein n=1 Tax=Desulfobotulus pelophilus TaxID=2823377 RepID=A0ABT3N4V1_9BACT|nr:zinc ribbon domain-containing protein [Desulfobotulus pelophilus]MCW7752475.1 zinc ribbon domain-containing protein [Desulfobotulus pelophilus]
MPIYEYHCQSCSRKFESLVMKRDETPGCPYCNSENAQRLMSACGFVSKGTGTGGEPTVTRSAATSGCSGCSASSCAGCGV